MKRLIPGFDYKRVSDNEVKNGEGLYDSELLRISTSAPTAYRSRRNSERSLG